jgi:hypothetical protein
MDNDEKRDPSQAPLDLPEASGTPEQLPLEAAEFDSVDAQPEPPPVGEVEDGAEAIPDDAAVDAIEDDFAADDASAAAEAEDARPVDTAETQPEPEAAVAEAEPDSYAEAEAVEEPVDALPAYDLPQALFDAGIDVDAALGALSFELASGGYDERQTASRLPAFTPPDYKPRLKMPAPIRLHRGHPGSVVPALVLIGVGAWLTLANANGTPADPALVGLVLVGGLMLSFLVEWLFNGRWARGLLLVALVAAFGAGGAALIAQSGVDNALRAYPLLLSALGVAIVLSALLARPAERVLLGPGMAFITAGIVGFLVLDGVIPASVLSAAAAYWFVPAVIVLLLLLLPVVFRRPA